MNDFHERFELGLPADEAYALLDDAQTLLAAMPGIDAVEKLADDRYAITVARRRCTLAITARTAPRRIAWETFHAAWRGEVALESLGTSRTLVVIAAHRTDGANAPAAPDGAAVMRALRTALERAAMHERAAAPDADDEVHVHHRNGPDQRARGPRGIFPGGDAFEMVKSLSREMDRLWEQMMRRAAGVGRPATDRAAGPVPAVDIAEREGALHVAFDVPGVPADALQLTIDPGLLVLRGERRVQVRGGAARSECQYGEFVRRIPLPEGLDTARARARLRLGVLDVAIPVYAQADSRDVPIDSDEFEGAT